MPGVDAFTDWHVSWDFQSADCRTAMWSVALEVTYTFPKWEQPADADADVITDWENYVESLWCHEFGHTDFGVDVASDVLDALGEIGSQSSCDALEAAAQARFDDILAMSIDDEIQYDLDTNYGETMGARFP